MARLRLLGMGPVEDIQCVLITGDTEQLKYEAMAAHEAWLTHPGSVELKITYANRLHDWAKAARNKKARAYAITLGAERQ